MLAGLGETMLDYGGIPDARLRQRLKMVVEAFIRQPNVSIPQACGSVEATTATIFIPTSAECSIKNSANKVCPLVQVLSKALLSNSKPALLVAMRWKRPNAQRMLLIHAAVLDNSFDTRWKAVA